MFNTRGVMLCSYKYNTTYQVMRGSNYFEITICKKATLLSPNTLPLADLEYVG